MNYIKSFQFDSDKISESGFDNHAIELFNFQAENNAVYKSYLETLKFAPQKVQTINQIPFLPIEFFKYHTVKTNEWPTEIVFESSGTSQSIRSKHHLPKVNFYHRHALKLFENTFGQIAGKTIVALLPSYLERQGSSLVSMVNYLIKMTNSPHSGFYLNELDELTKVLATFTGEDQVYLFGVTFALLELAEKYSSDLSHITIIETGGMKGRREEIIKEELYRILSDRLGIHHIYSEYGMTELLSQAYGRNGRFTEPAMMKVLIRDINDPFTILPAGKTGGINIIDLANTHSCAFIETKDLGRVNEDGSFEVLGRFDNSDLRGCNLLVG
jgi:phenylacetate-coenzyme A ligase PaaK-like adenylate-forming protein